MTKISKKHIYIAVGVGTVLLSLAILGQPAGSIAEEKRAVVPPPSEWRAAISGNQVDITGIPATSSGTYKPVIVATCTAGGLSMSIYFGVPMANSHRGTRASLITVDLRLDNGGVIPLVFSPSQDWTHARVLDPSSSVGDAMNTVGVTIDNLIFNAIGMKKQAPRADWSARRLLRTMAYAQKLSLRGTTRSGFAITAEYNLKDLQPLYAKLPAQCQ